MVMPFLGGGLVTYLLLRDGGNGQPTGEPEGAIVIPPIQVIQQVAQQQVVGGNGGQMTDQELRNLLESGSRSFYKVTEQSLTTAVTDKELSIEGDTLFATTDGSLTGIYVRLNHTSADPIYFTDINPTPPLKFYKVFLTSTAQTGKTLKLYSLNTSGMGFMQALMPSISISPGVTETTQTQTFHTIRTDKDTHFTGAIAQNVKEDENLTGLPANKIRITGASIQADQALHFKLLFWATDGFDDTDLDADYFVGELDMDLATNGIRVGGANQYYLDMRGLELDYQDRDESKELHVSLLNQSATAKNATTTGEVVIEVYYEVRA